MWPSILIILASLLGCTATNTGWSRAEVQHIPAHQQVALDKDREACVLESNARPILYQTLLAGYDVTACLERKGWKRVP